MQVQFHQHLASYATIFKQSTKQEAHVAGDPIILLAIPVYETHRSLIIPIFFNCEEGDVYANEFPVLFGSLDEVTLWSKWQYTLVLLKTSAIRMSTFETTRVRSRRLKVFALAGVTLAESFRDWETCAMPVLEILAWHLPYN
jgi:hypothetical protein